MSFGPIKKLNIWNFSQTKPLNILGPFWGTCMRGLSFTTALVGKNIHCKSGTDCMRYLHARTATRQECWGLCFDQQGWGGCSHWVCILDVSISISTICKKCPHVTKCTLCNQIISVLRNKNRSGTLQKAANGPWIACWWTDTRTTHT